MIYIDKKASDEPAALQEYIAIQTANQLEITYNDMPKEGVRAALMEVQGGLCCYCMNRIGQDNSLIEHFLPQSHAENYQVAFHNLFLACRHSDGKPKKLQHCDKSKGEQLIPNYISSENCASYFAYSLSNGQILPRILTLKGETDWERQKKFITIRDYRQMSAELSKGQKMVLATIDMLNLNSPSLATSRKKYIRKLLPKLKNMSHTDLIEMYDNASKRKENNQWEKFIGIKLYLLEWQLHFHKEGK